jgi:hypothetical protein
VTRSDELRTLPNVSPSAELQLDAVNLAPSGPNVDRAREWLAAALEALA